MTAQEFARWGNKAVTLLGMSGAGKTTLANKLPKHYWFHYSGDYRIGTKYLEEPILDVIKTEAMKVPYLRNLLRSDSIYIASNVSTHNLAPISAFLGKIGNPEFGGLSLEEFKKRQRLHHRAEVGAMRDVKAFIHKAREIYDFPHFVNDAGGSVCELNEPATMAQLAEQTLILYLRAGPDMEDALIQRQARSPKPLYYQEAFLDRQLAHYMAEQGIDRFDEIEPDQFVRWIFPRLVEHRRPLYQAIADRYGYTVDARLIEDIRDEGDFLALVMQTLGAAEAA